MKRLFTIVIILLLFVQAQAQYTYITNFSGTAAYGGVNVTVTSTGSVTTAAAICIGAPTTYWIAPIAVGGYIYTCSTPVYSIQIHAEGINGGTFGTGEYLQVYINGAPYTLTTSDITSYTSCSCGGGCGPCYLLGGFLYGPVGAITDWNGGIITINYCAGINSFEIYDGNPEYGIDYHVAIDTTLKTGSTIGAITGPSSLCAGSTIALSDTSSGGVWSSSNTGIATVSGGVVTGISAGMLTISYTTTGSCGTATATTTITVNPAPSAGTITGAANVCIGSSITLSDAVTGGTWSSVNINATVSGGIVTGISAGTDIIAYIVTNTCGTANTTKIITIDSLPSVGAITGLSTVCAGSTITLSDATAGGIWSSSNTGIATVSGGLVTGISGGVVTISYSVTNLCGTTVAIYNVTVNPLPNAGTVTGPSAVCIGSTITLSDGIIGGIWSSSNTAATVSGGIVAGISVGTDIIKYTVTNICGTTPASKTITINPLPDAGTITGFSTIHLCVGSTITLSDASPGGLWSSPGYAGIVSVGSASGIVTGVTADTATITYTVTNVCGTASTTHTVLVNPSPDAGSITGLSSVCVGLTINLSDTAMGGTWSSSDSGIATISGGMLIAISAGTDTIEYTVRDTICSATAIKIITVLPLPSAGIIIGPSDVCLGAAITLSDTATGGAWSVNNNSASVSAGVITGMSIGTDMIKYIVNNTCGSDTATKVITIDPLPDAGTISGPVSVCKDATITLSDLITGGAWSSGNPLVATIDSNTGVANTLTLGTATITYTTAPNASGCINSTTFTLSVIASPLLVTGNISQVSCYRKNDGSIAVTVSGGTGAYQYLWSKGDTVSVINDRSPGTYNIQVKDRTTQCTAADSFLVTQPDSLFITASVNDDTCKEGSGSISIVVTGGTAPYQYLWSNNAKDNNIKGLLGGTYSLSVTDMNNCLQNGSFIVADTCNDIIIHDVITPDGDGINDVWVVEGIQSYSKNTVQIFDKWGNLLYEKDNYNNDWGGRGSKGELLPDGTYFYLVKLNATNTTGGKNVFTGSILIKR